MTQEAKKESRVRRWHATLKGFIPRFKQGAWKIMLPIWLLILVLSWAGLHYGLDIKITAAGVLLLGVVSNAFLWLLAVLGTVPLIGPLIVKVLAMPLIWALNAVGYLVSIRAIRRGYSKDVITYRSLTIALLLGIIIGFVIASLIE
ncbi:MAG TPA: hypothetical protein VFF75_00710 [Methylophilaceae bacterium]|nr:hypothetical protein [Methylophilaceae bacterium]